MWVLQVGPTTQYCSLTLRPPAAAFRARLQGSASAAARPLSAAHMTDATGLCICPCRAVLGRPGKAVLRARLCMQCGAGAALRRARTVKGSKYFAPFCLVLAFSLLTLF